MPADTPRSLHPMRRAADLVIAHQDLERIESSVRHLTSEIGSTEERERLIDLAQLLCDICRSQLSTCERLREAFGAALTELDVSLSVLASANNEVTRALGVRAPAEPARPAKDPLPSRRRFMRRLRSSNPARPEAEPARDEPPRARPSNERGDATLIVHCLGSMRVYQDGVLVTDWNGGKAQRLWCHLLVEHRRRMPREYLAELLWPNADPEASRRNLHQTVYSLRQTLRRLDPDADYVQFRDETYFLNTEAMWIDFVEFEVCAEAGHRLFAAGREDDGARQLELAVELYEGDLFEDRLYEDRFHLLREHLRSVHLDVVAELSEFHMRRGHHAEIVRLNQRALRFDPYDEEAHRRLMEAFIAQGLRHLAVRQYESCRAVLWEELGLVPSDPLQRLRATISP